MFLLSRTLDVHRTHTNMLLSALKAFFSFSITAHPITQHTHTHTHHLVHLKYLSGTEVRGQDDGSGHDRDGTFKRKKRERGGFMFNACRVSIKLAADNFTALQCLSPLPLIARSKIRTHISHTCARTHLFPSSPHR